MPGGKRDRDEAERRLIAAVGSLLIKRGFRGLGVNKVAQEAEVSKPLIYDYFGDLPGLLHSYIRQKDYWLPLFDSISLPDPKDQDSVRAMITATLQEQFQYFFREQEMQSLVLWQISESNPLLRKVSDRREAEGAKVLALAELHFRRTGISLEAITALIVGGIYYMVLHAGTNKSTVCGIDVNLAADRETVIRTIGQVLEWAWDRAAVTKGKHLTLTDMTYEFELLENLTAQLTGRASAGFKTAEADAMLKTETRRLERVLLMQLMTLTNDTQIATFLQINLLKLITICDQLYTEGSDNHDALLVLELIDAVRKPVNAYVPGNLPLPLLFREQQRRALLTERDAISSALVNTEVDPVLPEVAELPFERFLTGSEKLNWLDFKYLKRYAFVLGKVLAEQPVDADNLFTLLVALGMNHSRLISWYANTTRLRIKALPQYERREALQHEQARISQVQSLTSMIFERNKLPVVEELLRWLDAELRYYPEDRRLVNAHKLQTTFRGIELAFWMKLCYDHGIYEDLNLDAFCEKIAANFMTFGQDDLSPSSIKSKLYTKDPAVLEMIEKLLTEMLDEVRRFRH